MEELKNLALLTLGAASVSVEKIDKTIQTLIEKGNLTVQQGRELREELVRKNEKNVPLTKADLAEAMGSLEVVSKWELEVLADRVGILEDRIKALEEKIK